MRKLAQMKVTHYEAFFGLPCRKDKSLHKIKFIRKGTLQEISPDFL